MPVLALNTLGDADTLADTLPLHLSAWSAAALESLIGGRGGRLDTRHLPALRALADERAAEADLRELVQTLAALGELHVEFL